MSEPVASYKFFYLQRANLPLLKKGKPDYEIVNKHSRAVIGGIEWYPPWWQYVFWATGSGVVWSADCLSDVQRFIREHAGKEANCKGEEA